MFDFTNYTYSGLLSLVSAVFGISYPLILDAISNIDRKYGATLLTQHFLKENKYRTFRGLLIINLVMAVTIPFTLSVFTFPHALLVSQTAAVILLIVASFFLYELIIVYQQPDRLYKRLAEDSQTKNYPIFELNELYIYLSKKDNDNLFWECWTKVGGYMNDQLKKISNEDSFPKEVHALCMRYRRVIREENESMLRKINEITPLLYPSYEESCQHIGKHRIIWTLLNDAVVGDNSAWIIQHWSWMDQYYRSQLKYISNDHPELNENRDFIQITHVMLGGLLVFHRRFSLLNDILFFTNVLPPEYPLLPNSLIEISKSIKDIEDNSRHFMLLESNFSFANLNHGVQNDSAISSYALKFLGLCTIRLWSILPTTITYQPHAIPAVPNRLDEIDTMIQYINQLKRCVEEWYNKDVFRLIEKLIFVSKENVFSIIDEWHNKLVEKRNYKTEHPQAENEKVGTFKDELIASSKKEWRLLPSKEDSQIPANAEVDTVSTVEIVNNNIEVRLFDPGFNICYTNLPDTLIRYMSLPTLEKYLKRINTKGVLSYKIQYKDIFKALDILAISDSHYLLSAGVYLGNYSAMYGNVDGFDSARNIYKGVTIHSIDSQMMSIFVIPKNCLPYVEYIGVSQTANLKPLDDADTSLYSNLDQILAPDFERSTFFLTLARGVRITSLKSGYKCIRLDVTHNSSEGNLDIDNVQWK